MTRQELDKLWEACRDGRITPEEQRRLDEHLAEREADALLFTAETQWLSALKDVPAPATGQAAVAAADDAARFARDVLDQWQDDKPGILARINWRTAIFSGGWAAAAAVIAVVMWVNQPPASDNEATSQSPVAMNDFSGEHPLTVLVQEVSGGLRERDLIPSPAFYPPPSVTRQTPVIDLDNLADRMGLPLVRPVSATMEDR
ncbi:MAG: hypothetical protein IT440_11530 [Phycisphaeraceae bacterium]|nr:hypothetical protein [Phycisphaeraceae bacterium]